MSSEQLEDFEELARRAVACKRWRWMPGMRYHTDKHANRLTDDHFIGGLKLTPICLPDLRDPATLGCLLALVREAWGDQQVHVVKLAYGFKGWQGWNAERFITAKFESEVEALVAALEAAP